MNSKLSKGRKTGWSAYHFTLLSMIGFVLAFHTSASLAAPSTPTRDDHIVATLPKLQASKSLQGLRQQLVKNPKNVAIAQQIATHYIQIARSSSDNRYYGYAKSVLNAWQAESIPPPDILFLRAVLKQHQHRYADAKRDLKALIKQQPSHSQAWLTLSIIQQLQGDYSNARGSCAALGKVASSWLSSLCYSQIMSLTGAAERAYQLQQALLLQLKPANTDQTKTLQWVLGLSAETAYRLGRMSEAESLFKKALALPHRDAYLLRVYSDFLLASHHPDRVLALLEKETHDDALLLRLAIAAKQADKSTLSKQYQQRLIAQYKAAKLRNSKLHERDEALYLLEFGDESTHKRALQLALANWKIQREPDDALILLRTAIKAESAKDIATIRQWIAANKLQDGRLTVLLKALLSSRDNQHPIVKKKA